MSWLTGLAGKAEELLNKVDQSAASALHITDDENAQSMPVPNIVQHTEASSQMSNAGKLSSTAFPQSWTAPSAMSVSGSVPTNLNRMATAGIPRSNNKPAAVPTPVTTTAPTTTVKNGNKKDTDAELFEFLNSDSPVAGRKRLLVQQPPGRGHSRQSSASSTTSGKSSRTPPDTFNAASADVLDDGSGMLCVLRRDYVRLHMFLFIPIFAAAAKDGLRDVIYLVITVEVHVLRHLCL